jgi:hypothetical protein
VPGEPTAHTPQLISLRSILIPYSHLFLVFQVVFSFGLSHRNPVHVCPLSHACYMPRPPHSLWFYLPNNIWRWVQITKLPVVHLLHSSVTSTLLGPNILLSTLLVPIRFLFIFRISFLRLKIHEQELKFAARVFWAWVCCWNFISYQTFL